MEEKNKCVRTGCSRILWAVLTIFLCAAPSLRADVDIPNDGKEYNIPGDFGPVVSGTLWVYGTVNILPGASVGSFVMATDTSILNIKGGSVGMWIDVAPGATVTVYGTSFKVDGDEVPYGPIFIDFGTLTVLYENATEPVSLTFDCHAGATVTLAAPGVGPQPVDIDIKPGSYPNAINLGSNGVIPVAILSSDTFDATTVDPETVFLAGAGVAVRGKGNKLASQEDVNGDGLTDLVVKLETENLDPDTFQNGTATLTGQTVNGVKFTGSDSIRIVPPA